MSERDVYEPGTPCWVDHSSKDPEAAARFYGELFGWETEDQMPLDAPDRYFMARLHGRDVAAMGTQQAQDAPPSWNTYVSVESVDDTVAKIRAAGGTVHGEPFDIYDAGRMAVIQDPSGAWLHLWQPHTQNGAGLVNEPGALCWNEVATPDPERAKAFYADVFGWRTSVMDPESGYTLWHAAGEGEPAQEEHPIGGMMPLAGADADPPPGWGVCFAVQDTDGTAASCGEQGGTVVVPPFDTPVGRTAVLADPQGASFAVIMLASPG